MYYTDIENNLSQLYELDDPSSKNAMLLECAKIGIFNPRTLIDLQKKIAGIKNGIPLTAENYWHIERLNSDKGRLVVRAIKASDPKAVKGHKRKNSFYYKSFAHTLTSAPIALTIHALQRYRERAYTHIEMDWLWHEEIMTDYLEQLDTVSNSKTIRRDIILPFKNGVFLGYPTVWTDSILVMEYNKRTQYRQRHVPLPGFVAYTYIEDDQLLPAQKAVYQAILNGEYDKAKKLQAAIEPKHNFDLDV